MTVVPLDPTKIPAGYCGGPSPHLGCPDHAIRNALILATAVKVFGGKSSTAAVVGVAAWYAASGLWWV